VLTDLVNHPILQNKAYEFIHFESSDRRGIDVAMLYKTRKFTPILAEGIEVELPNQHPTRLILYVQGITSNQDTLHLFINHWPSNYSGVFESQLSRMAVSKQLQVRTQAIFEDNVNAKLIIMGDFNNEPTNPSIQELLSQKLYVSPHHKTHKYQGEWSQLDFFMVSSSVKMMMNKANVYQPNWLLTKDQQFLGQHPYRTFQGKKYLGGYSDHLPIKMSLRW
jgi:endonuclease/exonuclease/phosphatase family metal-dependent hydrolase